MTETLTPAIHHGLQFLTTNGRLLERRVADLLFNRTTVGSALGVLDALHGYRNGDGGLGNALEPDLRAPTSQPLAVDFGLEIAERVADCAVAEDAQVKAALRRFADDCAQWLSTVVTEEGGLPIVLPEAADYPRASHWGDCRFDADLNPTAGVVVRLRRLGSEAPWLDAAERFCVTRIESMEPDTLGGHLLLNILAFLAAARDQEWAQQQRDRLTVDWNQIDFFHLYPGEGYGVTPLDIAPSPDDPLRSSFPERAITEHLDVLASSQQEDGGWGITWHAPGPMSALEWRGAVTLSAIHVLHVNDKRS